MTLLTFMSDYTGVWLIPSLFTIFFLLYKKQYIQSKKIFITGLAYILFIAAIIFICAIVALKEVSRINPSFSDLYRINIAYVLDHLGFYYRIFCENSIPYLFSVGLLYFLFKLEKAYLLVLLYSFVYIFYYLILHVVSSRYFVGFSIGLSMFLGLVISDIFSAIKYKKWNLAWGIIFIVSILMSAGKIRDNIGKIKDLFALAKYSYVHQKEEMARLSSVPQDTATIYVDNSGPAIFYRDILQLIGRKNIAIQRIPSKYAVDQRFFFEGETVLSIRQDGSFEITDKLGDWRF